MLALLAVLSRGVFAESPLKVPSTTKGPPNASKVVASVRTVEAPTNVTTHAASIKENQTWAQQANATKVMPYRLEPFKVIKIGAILSNLLLQLSPLRIVREIGQAGSTLAYDPVPIFTLFFGCLQWFLYASVGLFLASDIAMINVMQANVVGLVMGAFYLFTFIRNCHDPETRTALASMLRAGAAVLAFEVVCICAFVPRNSLRVLGALCAFFSVVVTSSPLVAIEDIFRTRSVAAMQTDMVIVCFCGSCAWTVVGFMMHDICIAVPNCFGIAIGSIQIHLILKFAETGLWTGGLKPNSSTSLVRGLEDPERTGTESPGDYEASLYKQSKICVLLAAAHTRFVLECYMHFASTTLTEACQWLVELQMPRCGEGGKGSYRWACGRCGRRAGEPGMEMSEREGLL